MSSLTDCSRSQGRGFIVAAAKKTRGGPSETRHGGCLRIEGAASAKRGLRLQIFGRSITRRDAPLCWRCSGLRFGMFKL
jgi:hypothetical protein